MKPLPHAGRSGRPGHGRHRSGAHAPGSAKAKSMKSATAAAPASPAPSAKLSGSTALAGPIAAADVAIKVLGKCLLPSPVVAHLGEAAVVYVGAAEKVLVDDRVSVVRAHAAQAPVLPAFELAGPRHKIFFDARTVGCGIVTCGGLCPGINNVVRGIVLELARGYGVKRILGFRYGYEGLISRFGHEPLHLTAE